MVLAPFSQPPRWALLAELSRQHPLVVSGGEYAWTLTADSVIELRTSCTTPGATHRVCPLGRALSETSPEGATRSSCSAPSTAVKAAADWP
jgi:hypothetical protein